MKLKYMIGAVAAITAVSCQKTDGEFDAILDPNAVRIEATVGGIFTRSNPLEEGAASAVFKTGDVMMVAADAQTAVGYTFNGTTWTTEANKYLRWDTPTMTFKAWYPQSASMTGFTLPTDQSTPAGVESADYMTYSGDQTQNGITPISLTLTRKMARVVISTSFNDQYASGYTVESIAVNGNTTGYENGSTKAGNVTVGSYKQDGKFYALLSPTTVDASATFLTITVKKTADGTTETLTVKGIPALAASTSYAYTVLVGKNTAKLGDVTVTDWTTGGALPDGETDAVTKTYIDATFAAALEAKVPSITLKDDNDGKGKYIDLADNVVMAAVKAVTDLNVSDQTISSLKGIELFTGLTRLNCNGNPLTTLDVSKLTNLQYLSCSINNLTNLDVSTLTNLTSLNCSDNALTTLDVSMLTNLTVLMCSDNDLTTLDVSRMKVLSHVECYGNKLTTLDLSMHAMNLMVTQLVLCGIQKDNIELRLIMTLPMYLYKWLDDWEKSPYNKSVIPVDPSGNPF